MSVTYIIMEAAKHSTVEVAEIVGVSASTLNRWIVAKKFDVPPVVLVGGVRVRLWSDAEIEIVRKYKATDYNKGRGHGKKTKGAGGRKPRRKKEVNDK
jgi:predicted DNA-binding transcriptional regulator AlpA